VALGGLLTADEIIEGRGVTVSRNADVLDAELVGELEVLRGRVRRDLKRDLDSGSEWPEFAGRCRLERRQRALSECRAECHSSEVPACRVQSGYKNFCHVSVYMLTYMSMIRTTVYLDSEVALALRQLSATEGRSQAELIRDAVTSYTKRAKRPAPKGLGKYRSGEPDVAQRAKDILGAAAKRGRWR